MKLISFCFRYVGFSSPGILLPVYQKQIEMELSKTDRNSIEAHQVILEEVRQETELNPSIN
jgi:hypothetical protein